MKPNKKPGEVSPQGETHSPTGHKRIIRKVATKAANVLEETDFVIFYYPVYERDNYDYPSHREEVKVKTKQIQKLKKILPPGSDIKRLWTDGEGNIIGVHIEVQPLIQLLNNNLRKSLGDQLETCDISERIDWDWDEESRNPGDRDFCD